MALPKQKKSKMKSRMRKSANNKMKLSSLSVCPSCGERKRPHIVCPHCGFYKGRTVIEVD